MNLAIEIIDLQKTYKSGTKALQGASLSVKQGECFALLGPNGAGKSTIIGILTGLVNPTSGEVKVMGVDALQHPSEAKACIGVVPQEFNFNIFETVEDIVLSQAGYYGVPLDVARPRCEQILKDLGLWDKRSAKSMTLSGGMKRRLMIARALCHQPKILILDEPTAGVDVELRRGMWDYLRKLHASGTTIILTSHYVEDVEALCSRMAIIKDGKVLREDRVQNVLQTVGKEHYTLTVDHTVPSREWEVKDERTIVVENDERLGLDPILKKVNEAGMRILDVRQNANRLEELLLQVTSSRVV
ncbi:ABC transporter ATP-binding protein [bacterium]|nr:ABC transporter ATP-binding protein [bacterium]